MSLDFYSAKIICWEPGSETELQFKLEALGDGGHYRLIYTDRPETSFSALGIDSSSFCNSSLLFLCGMVKRRPDWKQEAGCQATRTAKTNNLQNTMQVSLRSVYLLLPQKSKKVHLWL